MPTELALPCNLSHHEIARRFQIAMEKRGYVVGKAWSPMKPGTVIPIVLFDYVPLGFTVVVIGETDRADYEEQHRLILPELKQSGIQAPFHYRCVAE
jgi:hypothetical protein